MPPAPERSMWGTPTALAGQAPDFLAVDLIAAARIILGEDGFTEETA